MRTAFSDPQGKWKERLGQEDPVKSINGEVTIRPIGQLDYKSIAFVEPPSQFVHILHSMFGPDAKVGGFTLLVDGKRYYFVADVGYDLVLWYWTPSNLPIWAKKLVRDM